MRNHLECLASHTKRHYVMNKIPTSDIFFALKYENLYTYSH
jgi:hypothetical protein